jgi:hypothetical protein
MFYLILLFLFIATFAAGYSLGKRLQYKLHAQQIDTLEKTVFSFEICAGGLIVAPNSPAHKEQYFKLKKISKKLVSPENQKL